MNILIIGAGEIGFHLTKRLAAEKHNITIIEEESAKSASGGRTTGCHRRSVGSGSSYQDLLNAKIEQTDILAAISNIDEVNLVGLPLRAAN